MLILLTSSFNICIFEKMARMYKVVFWPVRCSSGARVPQTPLGSVRSRVHLPVQHHEISNRLISTRRRELPLDSRVGIRIISIAGHAPFACTQHHKINVVFHIGVSVYVSNSAGQMSVPACLVPPRHLRRLATTTEPALVVCSHTSWIVTLPPPAYRFEFADSLATSSHVA